MFFETKAVRDAKARARDAQKQIFDDIDQIVSDDKHAGIVKATCMHIVELQVEMSKLKFFVNVLACLVVAFLIYFFGR